MYTQDKQPVKLWSLYFFQEAVIVCLFACLFISFLSFFQVFWSYPSEDKIDATASSSLLHSKTQELDSHGQSMKDGARLISMRLRCLRFQILSELIDSVSLEMRMMFSSMIETSMAQELFQKHNLISRHFRIKPLRKNPCVQKNWSPGSITHPRRRLPLDQLNLTEARVVDLSKGPSRLLAVVLFYLCFWRFGANTQTQLKTHSLKLSRAWLPFLLYEKDIPCVFFYYILLWI